MATLVVLISVALTVYIAVMRSWLTQERRMSINITLDRTVKEMTRDLREAKEIDTSINSDEIRFTEDQTTYYIYYLYNSGETYPPVFDQASYELRKTALTGTMNGTFTYGSGRVIVRDVVPPPTTDLSYASGIVTVDLSVSRSDETIRAKTKVDPRNI